MSDILGAIRAEYKKRDTLLSIKKKLNKHCIISASFWVFVCLVGSLTGHLILQALSDKSIDGIFIIFAFLTAILFIPPVANHPIYILDKEELKFMQNHYEDYLYNGSSTEYIKGTFRDIIPYELDDINKKISHLRNSEFYGWSDGELHKYIQILDRVAEIEIKKKFTNRLLNFLNKQIPESCLLDGTLISNYPILAGALISSYPVAIFNMDDLTYIKSDPYLRERFKLALINNKMNVNESFKNDVITYLAKLDGDIELATVEALEFRKRINKEKHLDFVNSL